MYSLGMYIVVGGVAIWGIGWILILIRAFEESTVWGLAGLLLQVVLLIFVITHWSDTWKPFLLCLFGALIGLSGFHIMHGAPV
jgi:hypothetical protein